MQLVTWDGDTFALSTIKVNKLKMRLDKNKDASASELYKFFYVGLKSKTNENQTRRAKQETPTGQPKTASPAPRKKKTPIKKKAQKPATPPPRPRGVKTLRSPSDPAEEPSQKRPRTEGEKTRPLGPVRLEETTPDLGQDPMDASREVDALDFLETQDPVVPTWSQWPAVQPPARCSSPGWEELSYPSFEYEFAQDEQVEQELGVSLPAPEPTLLDDQYVTKRVTGETTSRTEAYTTSPSVYVLDEGIKNGQPDGILEYIDTMEDTVFSAETMAIADDFVRVALALFKSPPVPPAALVPLHELPPGIDPQIRKLFRLLEIYLQGVPKKENEAMTLNALLSVFQAARVLAQSLGNTKRVIFPAVAQQIYNLTHNA
jgi:hypothetical protein